MSRAGEGRQGGGRAAVRAALALLLFAALLSPAARAYAAERTAVAAANLSIELIDGMMEVEGREAGGALLMEPERNFVLHMEERKGRSFAATMKFVREAYIAETGLSVAEEEETSIGGKRAGILLSKPDGAEPRTRQSLLVLGNAENSVFAYVVYPAGDKDAAADVRKMFLSIQWPREK